MRRLQTITLLLIPFLLLAGCSPETGTSEQDALEQARGESPTKRIEIPVTVRNNLGITFVDVERRHIESTIRMPGAFELQPLARHEYRLTLSGRISLEVDQYQRVKPGDLLYRFRSPQWPELQHEIIVGEQAIDSAQAEIGVAAARIEETEKRLSVMRERLATLAEAEAERQRGGQRTRRGKSI